MKCQLLNPHFQLISLAYRHPLPPQPQPLRVIDPHRQCHIRVSKHLHRPLPCQFFCLAVRRVHHRGNTMLMEEHRNGCDEFDLAEFLARADTGSRCPGDVCLLCGKDWNVPLTGISITIQFGCGLVGLGLGLQPATRAPDKSVGAPNGWVDLHSRIVDEDGCIWWYCIR